MATGVDHPRHNFTFFAPPGREDQVGELRVYVTYNFNQTAITSVTSCWQLTDEEIEEIVRTRRVMINFLGGRLMAHYVTSESEMRQFVTDYGRTWDS